MVRIIKVTLLLAFMALWFSGCAGLTADYNAYRRSQEDAVFVDKTRAYVSQVQNNSSGVARSLPVTAPFADIIGWCAGSLVYLIASVYHGKSIKKVKV